MMKRTAFLFPGQGSQSLGMMAGMAAAHPMVEATFAAASAVLGYDLWAVCQQGPEEQLNRTETTQPAMLAAGVATWRVWREAGGSLPAWMAGHSLGEYSALVASGRLAFADAVAVVAERGRLMQQACPAGEGAMAAVLGLDDDQLEAICRAAAGAEVVSCANYNAPGQVVIAGHRAAVERAGAAATAAGARRVLPLPVSVPSHCGLMKGAAEELGTVLAKLRFASGEVPVIHNADVASYSDEEAVHAALVRQLWQPVRWTETIRFLVQAGVSRFVECGPGKVLAGLNRRIDREVEVLALQDDAALAALLGEEEAG